MSTLNVKVRWLVRTKDEKLREQYEYATKGLELDTGKTAVIVSDMWAEHWCIGATKRVSELAPKMNALITYLRQSGVKIIYCPSGTEEVYKNYEQKKNLDKYRTYKSGMASEIVCFNESLIPDIQSRIDPNSVQCDCGFVKKCNSDNKPWKAKGQIAALTIENNDLIGMDDLNVISYLVTEEFSHVLVMGVHANMCVIYREFGLKALKMAGITPIIVRDMTDCMVPREEAPYQDHFTALDYTIRFIEEHLAPSTMSFNINSQLMQFKFSEDKRKCKSNDWGAGRCGETFDDYDRYLNRRLLDPVKLRVWIAANISNNPGINGIELDYFEEDIPGHGAREGKEHTMLIPFGEYVTKMVVKRGDIDKNDLEPIIYYLGIYGKKNSGGAETLLGEVQAGLEKQFQNIKTITLQAQDGYRMNSIGGSFSPNSKLNIIYFRTQAVQFFEITQDGKNTVADTIYSKHKDIVWKCFYLNGCFRDTADSSQGVVFPYWLYPDESGHLKKAAMRNLCILREKTGTKEIKERKYVTFRDKDNKDAQLQLAYKYEAKN